MKNTVQFVYSDGHRACTNCATSKAKCVPRGDGTTSCERCHRLKKECVVQPRASRKRPRHTPSAATATSTGSSRSETRAPFQQQQSFESTAEDGFIAARLSTSHSLDHGRSPSAPSHHQAGIGTFPTSAGGADVQQQQLDQFRRNQTSMCPFVKVPSDLSAHELRSRQPLVFLAAMMAATPSHTERQKGYATEALAYIAESIIIQGSKELEILQGLLMLVNWFHSQFFINPQVTNILHLAMAMLNDLGLNQPTASFSIVTPTPSPAESPSDGWDARTLDERRALLGCFFISISVTTTVSVMTPMPWSPTMEEACRKFEKADKASSDFRLAKMARLQHIAAQIAQMQKEIANNIHKHSAPLSVYVSPFEQQLKDFLANLPENLRHDSTMLLTYHTAQISLYKIGLTERNRLSSATTSDPIALINQDEMQHKCHVAVSTFIITFISIPPAQYYYLTLPVFAQLAHAVGVLAKLRGCLPTPWLDQSYAATGIIPPTDELEQVALNMEWAKDFSHGPTTNRPPNHAFSWIAWLRWCVKCLESAIVPAGPTQNVPTLSDKMDTTSDSAPSITTASPTDPSVATPAPCWVEDGVFTVAQTFEDLELINWGALLDDISGVGLDNVPDEVVWQGMASMGVNPGGT